MRAKDKLRPGNSKMKLVKGQFKNFFRKNSKENEKGFKMHS